MYNALQALFVSFPSAGDSLISFDDDQATASQAPSVNAMTSQMQAMSKYSNCNATLDFSRINSFIACHRIDSPSEYRRATVYCILDGITPYLPFMHYVNVSLIVFATVVSLLCKAFEWYSVEYPTSLKVSVMRI